MAPGSRSSESVTGGMKRVLPGHPSRRTSSESADTVAANASHAIASVTVTMDREAKVMRAAG
jgi:hypothetical protein